MAFNIEILDHKWLIDIEDLPYNKRDKMFTAHYKRIATVCIGSYTNWSIPNVIEIFNTKTQNHILFYLQDELAPGKSSTSTELTYKGSCNGEVYRLIVDLRVKDVNTKVK